MKNLLKLDRAARKLDKAYAAYLKAAKEWDAAVAAIPKDDKKRPGVFPVRKARKK